MIKDPVLAFDGVWKRFRRGQVHDSLRDLVPAIGRRLMGQQPPELGARDFWALRDMSFEVRAGEVLGIIGPNGAGKSTTLKILNQIMDPTKGSVHSRGKIGSLIEVSAGFHQDLSGRQNVYLQGAIMGMKKVEVARKFDQIVEFSGISEFIDTPVKRYSNGMNARLGFSIAAHLEPDVLIIDEVLAVGDHAFQGKAFARIKQMATAGAPVVLVSHQLDRIAELCTKCILLDRGAVRTSGTAAHCINEYLHGAGSVHSEEQHGDIGIQFVGVNAPDGLAVHSGEDITIAFGIKSDMQQLPLNWIAHLVVSDAVNGTAFHSTSAADRGVLLQTKGESRHEVKMQMNVPVGTYRVQLSIYDTSAQQDVLTGPRVQFEVLERNRFWGTHQLNTRWSSRNG